MDIKDYKSQDVTINLIEKKFTTTYMPDNKVNEEKIGCTWEIINFKTWNVREKIDFPILKLCSEQLTCDLAISLYKLHDYDCEGLLTTDNSLIGTSKTIRVKIFLIDKGKRKYNIFEKSFTFDYQKRNGVFYKNIESKFLLDEDNGLLLNGNLIFNCEIFIGNGNRTTLEKYDNMLNYRLREFDDFEYLFRSSMFSDVTLILKNKELNAHKSVLSTRSRVFSAMFQYNMHKQKKNVIEINDTDYHIMQEVLRFMYTGRVNNLDTLAIELLYAANKYDVRGLKIVCEEALENKLDMQNVGKIIIVVDRCNTIKLKEFVFEFIRENAAAVLQADNFKYAENLLSANTLEELAKYLKSYKR